MILLITLSAFLFASLILVKKIYIFKYIDVEFYILVAHITSFFLILIYSLCNYSTFYSEKNILGFKKIAPYFVLIKAITLMNGFIFLYLLKFVKNSLHDNYLEDEEEPYYEKYGDF